MKAQRIEELREAVAGSRGENWWPDLQETHDDMSHYWHYLVKNDDGERVAEACDDDTAWFIATARQGIPELLDAVSPDPAVVYLVTVEQRYAGHFRPWKVFSDRAAAHTLAAKHLALCVYACAVDGDDCEKEEQEQPR